MKLPLRLRIVHLFLLVMALAMSIPAAILIGALISAALSVGTSLLLSLLQPKPPGVERNKQEIRITTSTYGEPIKRGYGTFACGGSVIYRGTVVDTVTTQRGGGKRRTPDTTTHSYSVSFGVLICDTRAGDILGITRIWADDKLLYSGEATGEEVLIGTAGGSRTAAGARRFNVQLGAEDQLPNVWYEADLGVGRVSAHRGVLTCWFDDFGLDDWFNRIPNLIFEVAKSDGRVDKIITKECEAAGMTAVDDLDVATLTQKVDGMIIANVQPARGVIETLSQSEQFVLVEVDGKLKGVRLPQLPAAVVPFGDLGTVEGGPEDGQNEPQPRVIESIEQAFDVPRKVTIGYFEASRNYEQGSQEFGRQVYDSKGVLNLNWPLVLTPDEANRRARILAVTAWTERFPLKFTLPPTYLRYHPGDVLTISTIDGRTMDVRIGQMDFAPAEKIEVTGVRQIAEAYTQIGSGGTSRATSGVTSEGLGEAGDADLFLSNIPPLVDLHANVGGIYAAVCTLPGTGSWRGATLYRNQAGLNVLGAKYVAIASFPVAATMGFAQNALPAATGIDTTNTLRVRLSRGALETISQIVFDTSQDANLCVLGKETIQFRDAVLVSGTTDTYDLSYLRRGMRGTASFVGTHAGNDRFVFYDDAVQRIPLNASDKGKPFLYIAVPGGREQEQGSGLPFIYEDLV